MSNLSENQGLTFDVIERPPVTDHLSSSNSAWGRVAAQMIQNYDIEQQRIKEGKPERPSVHLQAQNLEHVRKLANTARTATRRFIHNLRPELRIKSHIDVKTAELFLWLAKKERYAK